MKYITDKDITTMYARRYSLAIEIANRMGVSIYYSKVKDLIDSGVDITTAVNNSRVEVEEETLPKRKSDYFSNKNYFR